MCVCVCDIMLPCFLCLEPGRVESRVDCTDGLMVGVTELLDHSCSMMSVTGLPGTDGQIMDRQMKGWIHGCEKMSICPIV